MIKTITANLLRINSLSALSPGDYADTSIGPYRSSVGSHVRHLLGSVLFHAHSHAIYHFAIIGYLLHHRNMTLPDIEFGYNPTTPIVLTRQ